MITGDAPLRPIPDNTARPGLYVLQVVGENLSELTASLSQLIATPERIEVAKNERNGPNYVPLAGDVDTVLRLLRDRTLAAVAFHNSKPGIRFVLLIAPNVFGGRLSHWLGAVDFTATEEQCRTVWSTALQHGGLLAATLSLDDGVELSDDQLSVDTFPWQESRLVIAGVRDGNGAWVMRENPKPSW